MTHDSRLVWLVLYLLAIAVIMPAWADHRGGNADVIFKLSIGFVASGAVLQLAAVDRFVWGNQLLRYHAILTSGIVLLSVVGFVFGRL
jgi:hypothetical protein